MERVISEELQKLRDSGEEIFSISRIDTINSCPQEAYKTYRLHQKGEENIYGIMGTRVHDILEKIVNDEATEKDLLPAMKEELDMADMMGIEFPKGRDGSDSIREGWIQDVTHFCETYKAPSQKAKEKMVAESEFIYTTEKSDHLVGYIDIYVKKDNGHINIWDHKTSSMYTKDQFVEHNRQLVTYYLGMTQQGYIVDNVGWHFIKFVTVEYQGYKTARSKERTTITKNIERRKIGQELASAIERDMKEADYNEIDIEFAIDKIKETNRLDIVLPEEIANNYKIKPCYIKGDISEEAIEECKEYIQSTIDKWKEMKEFPPRDFYKTNKNGSKSLDIFYCTSLCQHKKTCDYIREFLEKQAALREGQNSDDPELDELF